MSPGYSIVAGAVFVVVVLSLVVCAALCAVKLQISPPWFMVGFIGATAVILITLVAATANLRIAPLEPASPKADRRE